MKSVQINIFDTDLVWKGTIDNVQSLVHRSSWYEIVNSELTISRTAQNVEEMQIGRIIIVNNDLKKALVIEDMTANVADDYWNFSLIPLKGLMNWRICHPTDSGSFTATTQAEVMMQLVNKNLVTQSRDNDRKFWNTAGTVNLLSVASIKTYGDSIDYTVDWETGYIGDALTQIANMFDDVAGKYPIGWNVYIKDTLDGFQMDTYKATNRTIRQAINNPVVFSEDYNNIKDATYFNSLRDFYNMAYMTWNNGTTDQTTAIANQKNKQTIGFGRKEIILDSSLETVNAVTAEGRAELNRRPYVETFTAEILDNPNTMSTYGINWFLGDIVTVQTKAVKKNTLISVDTQITQIEEIYDNGEYTINATFGEAKLTLIKKIKQAIKQKK
jgi:Siphovirus ReqiPepy6 Gp37-like protein